MRILHIEDSPTQRLLISSMLEDFEEELSIIGVGTIAAAKEILSATEFDIVLLDLNLPDSILPLETTVTIMRLHTDLPIVVLSSARDVGIACMRAGATWFAQKEDTVRLENLKEVLGFALETSKRGITVSKEEAEDYVKSLVAEGERRMKQLEDRLKVELEDAE